MQEVTKIEGAGNSSSLLSYSTTDNNPYSRISYYRLKQTDFDGQFEYSQVEAVTCRQDGDISIYPNPFTNSFTVQLSENKAYPTTVEVIDYLGRKVHTQVIESATTEIVLDENISKGTYFAKVFNAVTLKRIVKTK